MLRSRCHRLEGLTASQRNPLRFQSRLAVFAVCFISTPAAQHALAQAPGTWMVAPVVQQNGSSVRMPISRPVSRRSQLLMNIDTRWSNNFGYRPILLTMSSLKPTTTDRLITVRLHMSGWGWGMNTLSVGRDFEMPLGSTTVSAVALFPQYRMDQRFYWWEVWVDGVKDRDLTLEEDDARVQGFVSMAPSGQGTLSILTVGPTSSQRTLMSPNIGGFETLTLGASELPRNWLEYTCFDVVALSLGELRTLATSDAAAFQALLRWVRSGGQLWVSDLLITGKQFQELAELSKLIGVPAALAGLDDEELADGLTKVEDTNPTPAAWRPVRFRNGNPEGQVVTFMDVNTGELRSERDPDIIAQLQNDPNYATTDQQFEATEAVDGVDIGRRGRRRRWRNITDSSAWFVEQPLGIGTVRALRDENDVKLFAQGRPVPTMNAAGGVRESMGMDAEQLAALGLPNDASMPTRLALNLHSTQRWEQRHGMTPGNANFEFANLLVPGVGLAPVTEFRVLITLFVLLIGPANYWFLKRFRRLHLLVLTVPLAALLTTATLFAYAIVSDGFSTTIRAHSFTTLDQRTGEAACWARLSYYSGYAPGSGLTFPNDTAVYPIIPGWNEGNTDPEADARRELIWRANDAQLTRGWLRSRTPTQYLTIRARQSPLALELLATKDGMRATNKLGSPVEFVLAIDENGKLHIGDDIQADARASLKATDRVQAIRRLRELVTEHQPEMPAALAAPDSDFLLMQNRQQMRQYRRTGFQYGNERLSTNRVNALLEELAGLSNRPALNLPPKSYVAVTATGPEVSLGMEGAAEEDSFHVIVGQW